MTGILPEPKPEKRRRCGRIFDWPPRGAANPEGIRHSYDVCGLESGHDKTLEPTPHEGMTTGATWETYLTGRGKKAINPITFGRTEEEQAAGGREAIEAKTKLLGEGTQ